MRRFLLALTMATFAAVALAQPVLACGGLVAANGAVQLQRTTTLAAYHDGIEHYVTSFQYAGGPSNFGSIIPLPGVPTDVRRAGSWTLQRLEREAHPLVAADSRGFATTALAAPSAQVLLQTTVDALDITVLSGGGEAVLTWVKEHGYTVSDDAPAMLDFYAHRSPVFLAARFNAEAALARHQLVGDGTPIQITIPTPSPWVPLHILSLAKRAAAPVQADVFLLTDRAPAVLGLDPGVRIQASQPASDSLLGDLRSDKDSGWIPDRAWLTFVALDTTSAQLTHDLAIDPSGANRPSVVQAGYAMPGAVPGAKVAGLVPIAGPDHKGLSAGAVAVVGGGLGLVVLCLGGWAMMAWTRRRDYRRNSTLW